MPNRSLPSELYLSSLMIKGFRGFKELSIPELGRVTLITGKNGVGKTTILEAVRIYAERGRLAVLSELLKGDEIANPNDVEGSEDLVTDYTTLFHGRDFLSTEKISIGPTNGRRTLKVSVTKSTPDQASFFEEHSRFESDEIDLRVLRVEYGDSYRELPWKILVDSKSHSYLRLHSLERQQVIRGRADSELQPIRCMSLGPGLLNSEQMTIFWDKIALTEFEDRAVDIFREILGIDVERIAVVGNGTQTHTRVRRSNRRILVKIRNNSDPVPLKSFGDGAVRLLSVALALANSRNGFLVLDEAENGIHHSIQKDYWGLILRTATEFNVQVLATTHSWDCVQGFAHATTDSEEFDGILLRVEKEDENTFIVEYAKEEVRTATDHGIEVR